MATAQLKDKYREVFGLSEHARRRALDMADDADLRFRVPKMPGTPLIRRYQGKNPLLGPYVGRNDRQRKENASKLIDCVLDQRKSKGIDFLL